MSHTQIIITICLVVGFTVLGIIIFIMKDLDSAD
jgi:hypothetical protein